MRLYTLWRILSVDSIQHYLLPTQIIPSCYIIIKIVHRRLTMTESVAEINSYVTIVEFTSLMGFRVNKGHRYSNEITTL